MNFKLSLFITLIIGTLMVFAQPPPEDLNQAGTTSSTKQGQGAVDQGTGGTQQAQGGKTDIGLIATDAQKWKCFGKCNNEGTKAAEGCYEKCLEDKIAESKAGGK